ncbi:hypothetical protein KAFR_0G00840 [Kazachstania africana CBS 2517]|uniref:Uncharacterized protein n=1 Tax=Kazachstania africana (strain ATCC 22294 / BCRC 22015 / CBS 2517 / CECT 1963 / NBRC 1671 / NRRL Y-8276) TaxID=1071382 RepID=H2AXL7_KAZAF|nr:hypothetical protein KAFR_0G00840 [Kazachstania africana CBS 2517]CCF59117.1 hypothetical protein KAFR_0G00840 [Kazachstania africana CBS 2517]
MNRFVNDNTLQRHFQLSHIVRGRLVWRSGDSLTKLIISLNLKNIGNILEGAEETMEEDGKRDLYFFQIGLIDESLNGYIDSEIMEHTEAKHDAQQMQQAANRRPVIKRNKYSLMYSNKKMRRNRRRRRRSLAQDPIWEEEEDNEYETCHNTTSNDLSSVPRDQPDLENLMYKVFYHKFELLTISDYDEEEDDSELRCSAASGVHYSVV